MGQKDISLFIKYALELTKLADIFWSQSRARGDIGNSWYIFIKLISPITIPCEDMYKLLSLSCKQKPCLCYILIDSYRIELFAQFSCYNQ